VNISPITGSFSPSAIPATLATAAPPPVAQSSPTIRTVVDTVKLSQQAMIRLLTQQGQQPSDIANSLGISLSAVDGDLNITVPKATLASPASAAPTAATPAPVSATT
jgi:hypothetical protein